MKLSIIMPCFNVADTLRRALDSIFFQDVSFPYEILLVDDASSDDTLAIAEAYAAEHPQLRILRHAENQGNAMAFYDGLSAAQGEYFCVLDGDDYYTVRNKLQRQVDFLNGDEKQEFVAVAHYYVMDVGNGENYVPDFPAMDEFNYANLLIRNCGYYHTTTYMYRNIFKGNVPDLYKKYRGDMSRTLFHLSFSNKKVKILPFYGSVYYFSQQGIWSGMEQAKQNEYEINYYTSLKSVLHSGFEQIALDATIQMYERRNREKEFSEGRRRYIGEPIAATLQRLRRDAGEYAFSQREFVFQGAYFSEPMDSLCATLGYMYRVAHDIRIEDANPEHVCIVNGVLNPTGGGIFPEIVELIEIFKRKKVFLFVTNMESIPPETLAHFDPYPNCTVVFPGEEVEDKLGFFYQRMREIAPQRAYYYASHNDTWAQALMYPGPCKNSALFSFDHGFLCGLSNPNLDVVIAKRPVDYHMLKHQFGDKVRYIPAWSRSVDAGGAVYRPFEGHQGLITACAAARYYKIEGGEGELSYFPLVLELLRQTRGQHFHFGPIPEEKLAEIHAFLAEHGLSPDAFVHIPWSDSIVGDMLKNHVDAFLEPFPVVSYKLTLLMLSAGIPVVACDGDTRLSKTDFIYEGNLVWKTREDFIRVLTQLDAPTLSLHSAKSKAYFEENHALETVAPYYLEDAYFPAPKQAPAMDAVLHKMPEYRIMFSFVKGMTEDPLQEIVLISRRDLLRHTFCYKMGRLLLLLPGKVRQARHREPYDVMQTYQAGEKATAPFRAVRNLFVKGSAGAESGKDIMDTVQKAP